MSQTQVSAISATKHYAAGAAFWEGHAKLLQHNLDDANDLVAKLRAIITHGSPEELAEAKAGLLAAAQPAAAPEPPAV